MIGLECTPFDSALGRASVEMISTTYKVGREIFSIKGFEVYLLANGDRIRYGLMVLKSLPRQVRISAISTCEADFTNEFVGILAV